MPISIFSSNKKLIDIQYAYIRSIDYQIVTGLWSSSYYLGAFLGPTIAGFLVDAHGFEWTTVIFAILYCVGIVFNAFELSYTCIVQKETFWIKSEIDIKEV